MLGGRADSSLGQVVNKVSPQLISYASAHFSSINTILLNVKSTTQSVTIGAGINSNKTPQDIKKESGSLKASLLVRLSPNDGEQAIAPTFSYQQCGMLYCFVTA